VSPGWRPSCTRPCSHGAGSGWDVTCSRPTQKSRFARIAGQILGPHDMLASRRNTVEYGIALGVVIREHAARRLHDGGW